MTEVGSVEFKATLNLKDLPQQVEAAQKQIAGKDANIKLGVTGASEAAGAVKRVDDNFQSAQKSASGFFEKANQFVQAQQGAALFASGVASVSQELDRAAQKVNALNSQAVDAFRQRDAAIGNLKTIPGSDPNALIAGFKDLAKEQGNTFSQTQLLNSGYDTLSAGFTKTSDAINVTRASALLAKGGFTDVGTAADGLTSSLKAYGKGSEEATRYADILVATQNAGKIKVGEFVGEIGRIAPTAAAANIPLEQIGAILATLTNNGVKSSEAVTATSAAIAAFVNPSDEAQQLAKTLGIELGETAIKAKGLPAVLQSIVDKGDLSLTTLTKLANGNIEAGKALVPLLSNLKDFKVQLDATTNSQGSAADAAKIINAEFGEKLSQAANKANDAFTSAGAGIGKALLPLLDGAVNLIDKFNELPEPVKEFTGVVVGLTGAVLTLGAGTLGVAATLPILKAGFDVLTSSVARESGAIAANTALTEADAVAQFSDAAATEANAAAKAVAGEASVGLAGKAAGLAAGLGTVALQGGLVAAAIGAVTLAAQTFANGGQAFDDTAKKFEDDLKKIQAEADKTADKLGKVKPPTTGEDPNQAKGSGFFEQASDFLTKGQIEFGADGPKITTSGKGVGLSEKFANDQAAGAGNESVAANKIISEAQSQAQVLKNNPNQKAFSQGQLKATRESLDDVIKSTDDRLKGLKPGELGQARFEQIKSGLEQTKTQAEQAKAAFDKYAPSAEAAGNSTGKLGNAAAGTAERIAKASLRLKELQPEDQLRDATFANKKQDATTAIKLTQRTFGTDEDRSVTEKTNAAERSVLAEQITSTEKSLEEVRELKKAGGKAAIEATQQEAQLVTKLSGLKSSAAEKEIAERRLTNQKILDLDDRANQSRQAQIERSQSARTTAVNRQFLTGNVDAGSLGQVQTQQQTTTIDIDATQQRIALIQKEQARNAELKREGVRGTKEAFEKELSLAKELDSAQATLVQKQVERKRLANQQILEETDRRNKREEAALDRASAAQTLAARQQQLSGGGLVGEGGQAELQRIQEAATQQTIAQKQKELAEVNQLEARKVLGVREAEDKKLALLQSLDQERAKLLDAQTQRELRTIQNTSDAYKRQAQTATAGIDQQKASNDLLLGSLQRESQLVEAQGKVSAAVAEARQQQLKAAVDRASETVDSFKKLQDKNIGQNQRQVLRAQVGQLGGGANDAIALVKNKQAAEAEADREKLTALQQQQAAERKTEELKLRQAEVTARNNVLEAQRANISARIAENEQKGALLKALKTGDANEIANAQQGLALASQNVAITGAQIGNAQANAGTQQQVGQLGLQALSIKQGTDQRALAEQNAAAGRGRARELAETADAAKVNIAIDPTGGAASAGGSTGVSYNAGQTFGGNGFAAATAPSGVPTGNPTQNAASQGMSGGLQQLSTTLSSAIKELGEKLVGSMSRPNLTVSSPQPISDAAQISANISKAQVQNAGL